ESSLSSGNEISQHRFPWKSFSLREKSVRGRRRHTKKQFFGKPSGRVPPCATLWSDNHKAAPAIIG
ncbi:MAG: hypothetical protein JXR72_02430, partial [Proteobacteria bacterium]|nr:hypothetical protein [Pseudomonadota bacterium]